MESLHAEMTYDRAALLRLLTLRQDLFHPLKKRFFYALALALIVLSLYGGLTAWLSMLLMFFGCILLTNAGAAARRERAQLEKTLSLPFSMSYSFNENVFLTRSGETTSCVPYGDIAFLFEDRVFYYLFLLNGTCYMLERPASDSREAALRQWLAEKINQKFLPAGTAFLTAIFRRLHRNPLCR